MLISTSSCHVGPLKAVDRKKFTSVFKEKPFKIKPQDINHWDSAEKQSILTTILHI